jgi:hypothetical protein
MVQFRRVGTSNVVRRRVDSTPASTAAEIGCEFNISPAPRDPSMKKERRKEAERHVGRWRSTREEASLV